MQRFRLLEARSEPERVRAAEFRRRVFFERRRIAFDEVLEARRDREGHVFLLFDEERLVATGRALPYPCRLSSVLATSGALGGDDDTEIDRVAALPSPQAVSHALVLLTLAAGWLLEHTERRRYVAHCHPKLVELYRLLGAVDIGRAWLIAGRSESHRIVRGSVADAVRLGACLVGGPKCSDALKRTA
jgi:hypothetical protein